MAVITISREMGTGAYAIATEVARRLKYMLVDGARIAELAAEYGLTEEILRRVDEKPPSYHTAEDRLQAAYLNTIELILLDCARKGNVVIYGRGAQDLMSGLANVLRLRFVAPFDDRVENFAEREWIDPDLARELIRKSDHQRGGFIHFYFNRDWNDPLGYDMVFNTARLTKGAIVETIVAAARDPRLKEAETEAMALLDDIILSKRVETELLKSSDVENLHFEITVDEGEVILAGHVHTDEERAAAASLVKHVDGVRKLTDRLQVVDYRKYKGTGR